MYIKIIFIAAVVILAGIIIFYSAQKEFIIQKTNMIISIPSFSKDNEIPSQFTCDGSDINPEIIIQDVPKSAKSLVLIMDDPDATRGTFVHWIMWNISPDTRKIESNSAPQSAIQGLNGAKKFGYIGPCPPSGTHRYFFKLYALNKRLELDLNTDAAGLIKAMEGNILSQAQTIGLYKRIN